jgi:ribulose-phosphate 3-epimerase
VVRNRSNYEWRNKLPAYFKPAKPVLVLCFLPVGAPSGGWGVLGRVCFENVGIEVSRISQLALAWLYNGMNIGSMTSKRAAEAMRRLGSESLILPSLLQCDFGNLQREIERLEEAGVKALHLDVMDGHFVPNLTYGMPVVEGIRRLTDIPLDVHLMISTPSRYVQSFVDAGADCLTIHDEIEEETSEVLEQIREAGLGVGLAINPDTPLDDVEAVLPLCDLFLVMSVNAGFGGQSFNPVALEKLKAVQETNQDILLEVDGGINIETIGACSQSGASLFVVGSAIFGHADYAAAIDGLRGAIG